jgi:hypothetical protein
VQAAQQRDAVCVEERLRGRPEGVANFQRRCAVQQSVPALAQDSGQAELARDTLSGDGT